jgi:ABC-type Fe3+ transport system substrate-binding protein
MIRLSPRAFLLLSSVAVLGWANGAAAATANEQLYAGMAKLPAAERSKKIEEGAAKEGTVVVIPAFSGPLSVKMVDLFAKQFPKVKVAASDMTTEAGVERLVTEETAGRHLTDVIGATLPDINILLRKDLIARYPTPATDAILPRYRSFIDPENRWTPWYWSEHGISYNPTMLTAETAPKSYDDLCDPRFKKAVSYEPGETKWLVGMYLFFGEDKFNKWLECVGKNEPIIMKGHDLRLSLMIQGDHAVQGDNFLYSGMAQVRKNPKTPFAIDFNAPIMARAGVNVINTNAAHPYGAALWADWHLSDVNQKFVYDEMRGPLAAPHPYLKDDSPLYTFGLVPEEINAKVNDAWKKYLNRKG